MDQSHNEFYWSVSSKNVDYGGKPLAQNNQQIIFDNGMSLAMVPEKSFVELVKRLHDIGFECHEGRPVWMCKGDPDFKSAPPDIEFNVIKNAKGEIAKIRMPHHAYIMRKKSDHSQYYLMLNPWNFMGMGGKEGEEYWVMGAQFLQNYYSIYDFKDKRIGLVESVSTLLA